MDCVKKKRQKTRFPQAQCSVAMLQTCIQFEELYEAIQGIFRVVHATDRENLPMRTNKLSRKFNSKIFVVIQWAQEWRCAFVHCAYM